jgi:lysozyme family protein
MMPSGYYMPQNQQVQMTPGYMNIGLTPQPTAQPSTASLLASAFPPPTINSGLTPMQPIASNYGMPYSTAQNYVPNTITSALSTGNNSLQNLISQNIALTQEGTALSLYLQQVQQVLNTKRPAPGPIFAAPKIQQPNPTVISVTPASNSFTSNQSSQSSQSNTTTNSSLPMQATSGSKRAEKYEALVQTLKPSLSSKQQASLKQFQASFEKNKGRYEAVAKRLGVPDNLIALTAKAIWAIHAREGSLDFSTYLHNGEKLGKPTKLVPAGIMFNNWEDAAVDAIKRELPKVGGKIPQSVPDWLSFAEAYNGLGYENKGVPSPYVLAGTSAYQQGKYVADGKYDPNHKDQQLGVAIMLTS